MTVELRPVTAANWRECVGLRTTDAQADFVATNVISLAQAYVEPYWIPEAIYGDGPMVGFVMHGRDPDDDEAPWVLRLMVDARFQGRGYGREAMRQVIERYRATPDTPVLAISYEPENVVAAKLYAQLGFRETGEVIEGETVARLQLHPNG